MSTYYYAICTKHRVKSRVIGGRSAPNRWWQNTGDELSAFLAAHGDCEPLIVNEHDQRLWDYDKLASAERTEEPT